ncbi:MAG: transglutaminase domain-containing protein [Atopobiaceae bacterium]|nr:hypothetical protein [Atopobiaceae bacterium]
MRKRGLLLVALVVAACSIAGYNHWLGPRSTSSADPLASIGEVLSPADETSVSYPNTLPSGLQDDFARICTALSKGSLDVDVSTGQRPDLEELVQAVQETPELFWAGGNVTYTTSALSTTMHFKNKYADADSVRAQVDSAADAVVSGLRPGSTDYEKSVELHDWLCDHAVYASSDDGSDQDVYGALVSGRCVCAGYATAYCYLLRKAGIDSVVIEGSFSGSSHAWNRVTLDGDVYYTDVTGDDQADQPAARNWLNLTSAEMLRSHLPSDQASMPESVATADNWYVRHGYVLDGLDTSALEGILAAQDGSYLDVSCAGETTYGDLLSLLQTQRIYRVLTDSGHACTSCRTFTSSGSYAVRIETL